VLASCSPGFTQHGSAAGLQKAPWHAIASRPGKNVATDTINHDVDTHRLVALNESGKI
jgi:hypothetical protein